ncbi:hypothetical protein CR513_11566, partial [Mucuna pruriens]
MEVESNRETIPIKVKSPGAVVLRRYAEMFKGKKFGKILDLMEIEIQPEAISALAQFYDLLMRSFLFQNFQMAPTLEEYECILGRPQTGGLPYLYQGNWSSPERIAKLLRVSEMEILKKKQQCSGVEGIPLLYLEERMHILAESGSWDTLADTLELAVYAIILLPHLNDYIDLAAIDVFIVVKERGLNPTVAVLANTYYSLQCCYDSRGRLVCCLPALYIWIISYTFVSKRPTVCPIEDHKWCLVPNKNESEWASCFASLIDKDIR